LRAQTAFPALLVCLATIILGGKPG
jgi:hypothetical protein